VSVDGPQTESDLHSLNPYQQVLVQADQRHRLFSVHWELTYRCNQHCSHCYLDVFEPGAAVPEELSTQECLGIIDQIAAAGAFNLTLSGGELFVRKDWLEIARYARAKRLLLRLLTNGILVRPRLAEQIASLHPYAVEISLYSTQPEIHESITRRPRSWELTMRAFRLLHDCGVRTVMKTPLMRENAGEVAALRQLAEELGASFRHSYAISIKDSGALDPLKHRLTYPQLMRVIKQEMDPKFWVNRQVSTDQAMCGIGKKALIIDPYGNVDPCMEVRSRVGNLRERSLLEIWEGAPIWKELGELTLDSLPVCRDCELRNLCVRCHGTAFREQGDILEPAIAHCIEALARRQVLVESGAISQEFPIPAHILAGSRYFERPRADESNSAMGLNLATWAAVEKG
jgi:radical SAM protein with 4Fe4S-binding SPASM domain